MSSKTSPPTALTTTSYAILGLLAIKPWSSYELTQQMDRSLGRFWPRAQSKLYEEPKKLVAEGLARATDETTGRRPRTMYSITAKGRRALARWLDEPGAGPVLEVEQLLKVFFADHGSRDGTLAALAGAAHWAGEQAATALTVGLDYEAGRGRFPERRAQLDLTARFLTDFYAMVADWALWATEVVERWPDDPAQARTEAGVGAETIRRAARVVDQTLRR